MLILDYQRWMHHDIPILFYQYKDDVCPCLNPPCLITPSCSVECESFLKFVYVRMNETVSFLRSHMKTHDYYKYVETGDTYTAGAVTVGLIHLYVDEYYQNKIPIEELKVVFSRYVYSMHRAQQICNNRKAKTPDPSKERNFYINV